MRFYGINDAGVLIGGSNWVVTLAVDLGQVMLAYGDVSISDNPVSAGTSVRDGDSLSVGEDGFLVFTLSAESGEHTIWVDANSELSVAGESTSSESAIEIFKGRIRFMYISGRIVNKISDRWYNSGLHKEKWSGKDNNGNQLGNGIYLLKTQSKGKVTIKKLVFQRR